MVVVELVVRESHGWSGRPKVIETQRECDLGEERVWAYPCVWERSSMILVKRERGCIRVCRLLSE